MAQPLFPADPTAAYRVLLESEARVELIDGEVVVHASPGLAHSFGAAGVGADLYQAYQRGRGGPGGWWILPEVDIEFDVAQAYRPDIAGWRSERVARIPKDRPIRIIPDFVCEVLAPSNSSWDLGPKRSGYERAGVCWYWILNPMEKTLDAFELRTRQYAAVGQVTRDTPGRLPPFDQVLVDMRELFPIEGP